MRDPQTHGAAAGCPDDVRDQLPALLHGRLAGEARARAEAHVAACAECAAELALLGDTRSAVVAAAPAIDVAAIAAAVRAATVAPVVPVARPALTLPASVRRPSRWRVGRAWQAAAAALVLAVGVGSALLGRGGGSDVAATPTAQVVAGQGAGGTSPAAPTAGGTAVVPDAAPTPAPRVTPRSAQPDLLASAEPALGAGLDDLTDAELDAVLAAVAGDEGPLPSEEPEAALPTVGVPGGR